MKACGPHRPVAERYLELLLDSRRREAMHLILSAVEDGLNIRNLYLRVIEPVMREVGWRWQTTRLSVG